ncbi:hypothetical protein D7W09_05020 [bacterium D16-34]|nr:hypothetical protein D7W09_05020 [bacterium D16-34]
MPNASPKPCDKAATIAHQTATESFKPCAHLTPFASVLDANYIWRNECEMKLGYYGEPISYDEKSNTIWRVVVK